MGTNKIASFDLKRNYQRVKEEINVAVERVLESQQFVLGPEVEALEHEIALYLGADSCAGCASGTDALLLAMKAIDIRPGDEVITTPFTFFATASCITRAGGTPVFADVDPYTYNITPESIMEHITPKTRAVLPVHIFGQMAPVETMTAELAERGIVLVEDCAQAIGAHRMVGGKIRKAGTVGALGCFSFFPTKNLGCYGDGGMVSIAHGDGTQPQALASRIKSLRVHGAGTTYFHDEVGINSRLDALQAAILRVRLRHLEEWTTDRRLVAERYRELFAHKNLLEFITPPKELEDGRHVFHQYVVRAKKRDELQKFLAARGIASRVYYPLSLHLQHCFSYLEYKEGDFPVSEMLTQEVLALPMFPELLAGEQEIIVSAIADFYKNNA